MSLTRTLAEYLVRSRPDDVPSAIRHEATRAMLNWVGCAIGGCRHESVHLAWRALGPTAGAGSSTLIGRKHKTDALTATLINGIGGHVLDFDDAQPRSTNINPSAAIAPAVLALGEQLRSSGASVLHALLLGIEVECRIANAVWAKGSTRFFANSTAGVFGAAAAAGKLLGLDERQMTWALGIAAAQSAGLRIVFGTMCKGLVVARAAQNGIGSALLAQQNFTGPDQALEARNGFGAVFGPDMDLAPIIHNLGSEFEISHITYKPYACGIVLHAPIDACIRVSTQFDLNPDDIEEVELDVNPAVLEVTGNPAPATGLEGKFSITHSAAVALIDRSAGEAQYSDARVQAPDVQSLRARVRALRDETLARHQARLRVRLANGEERACEVEQAIGSRGNPLSDEAIADKVRALAAGVLENRDVERVIDAFWNVEDMDDIGIALAATRR